MNRPYKKISDHEYLVDCSIPSTNDLLKNVLDEKDEPVEVSTDTSFLDSFEKYIKEKTNDEDNPDRDNREIIT